jgi:hypothetical protein
MDIHGYPVDQTKQFQKLVASLVDIKILLATIFHIILEEQL